MRESDVRHRHLDHARYSLAAIDDVIARGRWTDWANLRRAVRADPSLLVQVERVCRACAQSTAAQRHHFWLHYVRALRHRNIA